MKIRILLADDHKIVREGLRGILEREPQFEVIAEVDDGRSAIRIAAELIPDVIVMDITMPDLNGIDATRQILRANPNQKILALSVHSDRRYLMRMLEAGARGYLRKDCASQELIEAIHTVVLGEIYVSPLVAAATKITISGSLKNRSINDLPGSELTLREREVLQMVAEGKTTRDIALLLSISIKAIEKHRHSIMEKLDLHTIADLTRYAITEGMIPPEL